MWNIVYNKSCFGEGFRNFLFFETIEFSLDGSSITKFSSRSVVIISIISIVSIVTIVTIVTIIITTITSVVTVLVIISSVITVIIVSVTARLRFFRIRNRRDFYDDITVINEGIITKIVTTEVIVVMIIVTIVTIVTIGIIEIIEIIEITTDLEENLVMLDPSKENTIVSKNKKSLRPFPKQDLLYTIFHILLMMKNY